MGEKKITWRTWLAGFMLIGGFVVAGSGLLGCAPKSSAGSAKDLEALPEKTALGEDRPKSGTQFDNSYGGKTVYDSGASAEARLQVHGPEWELLCSAEVVDARYWPVDFDPGSDVDCDLVNSVKEVEGG